MLAADLHCHILPGLDDGAADLDDSVAMAARAERDGIELVCATPHIRHDHRVAVEELPARVEALNRELERRGVRTRVAGGGEVAETALAELGRDELAALALGGGGRWVLLEPRPGPLSETLLAALERLDELGFGAVVAHPERHLGDGAVDCLTRAVRAGALVQVTAALLLDAGAAPAMLELAARGLAHVLGSDSHSSRVGRPVALSAGLARLTTVPLLTEHAGWIARDGPAAIVRGVPVSPPWAPT